MVKQNNKRVVLTFTPKSLEMSQQLCELFDMTLTHLVRKLIADKYRKEIEG